AADLLTDLLADGPPDLLSLAWTTRLLDAFLLCLEDFRALLFGPGAAAAARPPLDRLVADFFDRAVKALDLCNAVRDGLDLVRQWRNHLAIAAAVLFAPVALLGEQRSLSGSVSRAWSAVRQLQAIAGGLPVPRPHER
ncbi:protein ROH1-like, partial [Panicum virgatum]|uniref:protein ROH1-like n=1 Tax=Panicum virgatum TaxID=38727 RepID=UPI0019D63B5C